jgi:hypothetical protein
MKNLLRYYLLAFLCVSALGHPVFGQEVMKQEKQFKNTVRLNLTNPLIFGDKAIVLGYERTLGQHRSISINIGQAQLPKFKLIDIDSSVMLNKSTKEHGFNMTIDYRFYLRTDNKYPSPRGVYLAPYFGYNTMGRSNTWTLNTDTFQGEVNTDFDFSVTTLGGELGYQFVMWKRVSLDFVLIGPGLASYKLKTKLNTTLNADDESALYEKINDALAERFPGYTFVLDDIDFKHSGSSNTTSFGYRYVINLGFRF